MRFYVGLHHPSAAQHFARSFVSVNVLAKRVSDFQVGEWIMDSGAFSTVLKYGGYPDSVATYAAQVKRWAMCGRMEAAVSQDYMCEPFILARTGKSVQEHQALTVSRYRELRGLVGTTPYIMPVLQGYDAMDYVDHLEMYGPLLTHGMWVGVGSVCKRNSRPFEVAKVLSSIKLHRPDLRLHGFGLKLTALSDPYIRSLLHSADSMAWSFAARRQGRNANDWREAEQFVRRIAA